MSTKIKWADVAHHYLKSGISVRVGRGDRSHRHGSPEYTDHPFNIDTYREYGGEVPDSMYFSCRPMLRPLSLMTDDEAVEVWNQGAGREWEESSASDFYDNAKEWYAKNRFNLGVHQWTPYELIWLISKGFDVFGLLESGQAATIERQPYEVSP